jgi:hypothetical protein
LKEKKISSSFIEVSVTKYWFLYTGLWYYRRLIRSNIQTLEWKL